jgi:chemotaxis protein histidine kinase CheA
MMKRRSEADSLSTAALASLLVAASPAFAQDATDGTAGAKPGDVRLIEPRAQTIEDAREDAPPPPEPPAETLYNLGVARYRQGDLAGAERLFRAAAERGRSEVAARAMFNEGTTAYADVLRVLEAAATPPSPDAAGGGTPAGEAPRGESQEDPLEQAITRLESGLRILKDAIRADPDNEDARVNAELAQRLLRQLRRQQQQQQQDQQSQDQQNQDQQNQDQQNQDQQNQDQQNQDQQNQQQQNQQQQNQQQQQQQSQEGQEKSESPAEPKPRADEAKERKPLTREEIERLLQRVRLKEAQRLERQAQEERARRKPAPKDW